MRSRIKYEPVMSNIHNWLNYSRDTKGYYRFPFKIKNKQVLHLQDILLSKFLSYVVETQVDLNQNF